MTKFPNKSKKPYFQPIFKTNFLKKIQLCHAQHIGL